MPAQRLQRTRDAYADDQPTWRSTRKTYITTFVLGVDTCPACGTKGKYDCPECGCWHPPIESAAYRITQAQLAADTKK